MKKRMVELCALVLAALTLGGCLAAVQAPVSGFLYTDTQAPLAIGNNVGQSKVGTSQAVSILGIIATGDASVEAAAKQAGITKIHHVDYKSKNILGIYGEFTTVVYGE